MAPTPLQALDLNGAELIVRFLEAHGVAQIFAAAPTAGGALMPLRRALADSRLTQVFTAQEQSVGFVAQGYARSSGRAGVCLANAGAGVTQLIAAIADAQADAVPLVAICGQEVPSARVATAPLRTGHIVDTLTKTHFEIRAVDDLVDALPEAFRIAESGRPGPVVIAVPAAAQVARIKLDRLPCAVEVEATDAGDGPRPDRGGHLADLRREAARDDAAECGGRSHAPLIRTVAHALGDDAVVVCDGGAIQRRVACHYPQVRAERWLTSGALGITGFALPAAIGAALAQPGVPVVAFCDADGSLPYLQELATLDDLQLDVKLVVLDPVTAMPRHDVAALQPRRFLGPLSPRRAAACALAESFGVAAVDLGLTPDPLPRLREALRQPGPLLIRAPFDPGTPTAPRAAPRRADTVCLH